MKEQSKLMCSFGIIFPDVGSKYSSSLYFSGTFTSYSSATLDKFSIFTFYRENTPVKDGGKYTLPFTNIDFYILELFIEAVYDYFILDMKLRLWTVSMSVDADIIGSIVI